MTVKLPTSRPSGSYLQGSHLPLEDSSKKLESIGIADCYNKNLYTDTVSEQAPFSVRFPKKFRPLGVSMPKPRVFIGSSVEGLNVAYAVQQNLLHEAEVTVWDQGVFELSRTTMESLTKALFNNDFAIFIFSPDDLVRIRDLSAPAVRDNVLFEFGLFIGRLGRERVFFLLPSVGELHLPTDLLGVTPGRYDSTRTDGSMQAATGAVCHQIRLQIKTLGLVPGRVSADASMEGSVADKPEKRHWFHDFNDKKYDCAKATLESELKDQSGEDALNTKGWILYCELKLRNDGATDELISFATEHVDSSHIQSLVAAILRGEGHVCKAIQLLSVAQAKKPKDATIAIALAQCHTDGIDNASAIAELERVGPDDFPDVALEMAEALERDEKNNEAIRAVHRCYANHPNHKGLRYKYACLAQKLDQHEVAAYLLDNLTKDDPNSIEYWGYLGNSCLQLDLYDMALYSYRRAERLMKEGDSSQWIVANIGNLLTNKGLPTDACEYLERALKFEPRSEYSHDRLAGALKKKTAENKEFQKKCAEGKRQVLEAAAKAFTPSIVAPNVLLGLLATTS
jgi:predicted Zn-dependent protease